MHLGSRHMGGSVEDYGAQVQWYGNPKPCPLCEECDLKEKILMEHLLMEHRDELGLSSTIATVEVLLSLLVKDNIIIYVLKSLSCELSLTDS